MRARTIIFVGVILSISFGSAFAATAPDPPASSTDHSSEPKCAATNDRSVLPGCACFSAGYVPLFCPPGASNSPGEPKASRETEAILQISERTLRDVEEHTDFLATLWKWTTIVSSIVAAVIALFGIKTFSDLSTAKDKALEVVEQSNQAVVAMEVNFSELSQKMSSNFFVMMSCVSVQGTLDAIASERTKLGTAARGNAAFERRETDTYRGVLNLISTVLQKHDAQDHAIAAYAYDILGLAQSKLGHVSDALESAKKSIAFSPKNATALYNAACYAANMHLVDVCVEFLERAIEANQDYLTSAKSDPDFDSVRGSAEFTRLVGA